MEGRDFEWHVIVDTAHATLSGLLWREIGRNLSDPWLVQNSVCGGGGGGVVHKRAEKPKARRTKRKLIEKYLSNETAHIYPCTDFQVQIFLL